MSAQQRTVKVNLQRRYGFHTATESEYYVSAITGALILSVTLPGAAATTNIRAGDWITEPEAAALADAKWVNVTVVPYVKS
jgi:S1-C subfamily serine protease